MVKLAVICAVSSLGAGLLTFVFSRGSGEGAPLMALPIANAGYILGSAAGVSLTSKEFFIKNSYFLRIDRIFTRTGISSGFTMTKQ